MTKIAAVIAFANAFSYTQATLYADGGYQSEIVACMPTWTYKEKTSTDNIQTTVTGCVSFTDLEPYPFFDPADSAEIKNLLEPTDPRTDKGKWCAVLRDVYNPTPQNTDANKYNWGYCLDDSVTLAPTHSSAPTSSPITPEPTLFPTVEGATGAPTPAPTTKPPTTKSPTVSAPTTQPPTLVEGQTPTTNGEGANADASTTGLDQWTLVGIAVAAVLVVVAGIMATMLGLRMRKNNDTKREEVVDEQADDKDIESPDYMERS